MKFLAQTMSDAQTAIAPDDDKLKGWKEIAAFLHTSVRTVQRWELGRQLPVRRIETSSAGIIYASRRELDEWLRSSAGRSAVSEREGGDADELPVAEHAAVAPVVRRRRRGVWLAAGIILSLASLASWRYSTRGDAPAEPRAARGAGSSRAAPEAGSQTLFLRITAEGRRASVVGLAAGSLGLAGVPGGKPVGLLPSVVGARMELCVYRVDGKTPEGQPRLTDISRHWLEPDVPVQLDLPDGRATFEWVSGLSAQPSNLQRGR